MQHSPSGASSSLRPIASLLLAAALLLIGNGLLFTLLPLRGAAEGFGAPALGVMASAYYFGFVGGCVLAPSMIRRVGHIRAFAAAVAVAAAATLAHALLPDPAAWTLFRLVAGFCLAAFYLVLESWLNDRASNETRGRVMSTYIVVNLGALTLGQMLVPLNPIGQAGGFMIAAMVSSLAIVPVALTALAQPAALAAVRLQPRRLYQAAPVALVASFMIGLSNGAFWGLGALSVGGSGLRVGEVAWFMSIAVLAGALMQWPLGRLSDRVDRRLALVPLLIAAAGVGLALWLMTVTTPVLLALGFLFGATALPGYSLAAAHGYDKTAAGEMVATAATILLANGLGSAIGPLLASATMAELGPRGLFLFTAVTQALLAAYIFYRTRVRASLPPQHKTGFDLATTAPVGAAVAYELVEPAETETPAPAAAADGADTERSVDG